LRKKKKNVRVGRVESIFQRAPPTLSAHHQPLQFTFIPPSLAVPHPFNHTNTHPSPIPTIPSITLKLPSVFRYHSTKVLAVWRIASKRRARLTTGTGLTRPSRHPALTQRFWVCISSRSKLLRTNEPVILRAICEVIMLVCAPNDYTSTGCCVRVMWRSL